MQISDDDDDRTQKSKKKESVCRRNSYFKEYMGRKVVGRNKSVSINFTYTQYPFVCYKIVWKALLLDVLQKV